MILFDRLNPALRARAAQIERNNAALKGGRPYIDLRLWRAPNESDLSWYGSTNPDAAKASTAPKGVVSRRDRACIVNDAGRIATKIGQYLFSKPITRAGIDEDFAASATADGLPINDFWAEVNDAYTAGQWVWVQADRGAAVNPDGAPRTLADRAASGDRIVWRLWDSLSVVDWSFDHAGHLSWLLTTERSLDDSDPMKAAEEVVTRTLWRADPAGATWEAWQKLPGKDEAVLMEQGRVSSPDIPFVLIGHPSADPWWYDDVELIQAQALNLDSLHTENLIQTVYPQLIIPSSMYEGLEARIIESMGAENGDSVAEVVREIVRGLDRPLVEAGEDKGTTRFIQPNAADLQAIPMEEARKRSLLFDQVGLSLFNKESRQVQSAASKQFDHLDTEATLAHRAGVLQAAETRLVDISRQLDSAFPDYKPEWPTTFAVPDLAADTAALLQLMQIPVMTLTQRKQAAKIVTRLEQGFIRITDEDLKAIEGEIEEMTEEPSFPVPDYQANAADGEGDEEPPPSDD